MYYQNSVPIKPKPKVEQHKMLFERKRISNFSNQKTEFEKFANFSNYFLSNRTNFELKFIEFFELFLPFRINRTVNFRIELTEFRTNPSLTPPLIQSLPASRNKLNCLKDKLPTWILSQIKSKWRI